MIKKITVVNIKQSKPAFYLAMAIFLGLAAQTAHAQDAFVPLNRDVYHLIDRYQIKYADSVPDFHPGLKPYRRSDVARLADAVANHEGQVTMPLTG
ncbi:MAG: hypothetical protein EOO03_17060, partial [Chitinophagaceae bacterium]